MRSSGDGAALGELIQGCREYLLLVANQDLDDALRPKIGGSDVVQETLVTAQVAFDQFNGSSRAEMLAWLRAILKNDLLSTYRHYNAKKRRIQKESPLESGGCGLQDVDRTPGSRAALEEQSVLINAAMSRLSAEYRQVLQLRNWQDLGFAEIGEAMGRSEDAARKLWARAVLKLKQELKSSELP